MVGAGAVAIIPSIFNLIHSHPSILLYCIQIELIGLGSAVPMQEGEDCWRHSSSESNNVSAIGNFAVAVATS